MKDRPNSRRNGADDPSSIRDTLRPDRRSPEQRRKSPEHMLNQVEADLARSPLQFRFNEIAERRFQETREPARVRHFVWTSVTGLLLYDLFLVADISMFPDILIPSMWIHLALITPVGLTLTYLIHRRKVPAESIIAILLMILGQVSYTLQESHAPHVAYVLFTIPLVLIFGNIVLPLPFMTSAAFFLFTAVLSSWAVWALPGLNTASRLYVALIQIHLGVFTLIATYRMERGERQAYLLTLREALRGELLVEQNRALSELSETDGLTGVPNRRVFDQALERLWREHQQSRTQLALLIIDIDHFKRLNDTHGHMNGDACLRKAASRLSSLMHAHQILARYGGEEFAVLLEGEGAFRAEAVAERLRAEIEAMPILMAGTENKQHHITISIGCATAIPRAGLSPAELFLAADKALYAAKHNGRNRVHAHSLEQARASTHDHAVPTPTFEAVSKTNR